MDVEKSIMLERMRKLRRSNDMNQQQVADYLNVQRSTYTKYERGDIPLKADVLPKLSALYGVSIDYLMGGDENAVSSHVYPPSETLPKRVPLFGAVAAGEPIYADGDVREYVDAPSKADYALTVQGDSMEPDYLDGDIVYIRKQETVDDGRIAVVIVDDAATLKRVYRKKNGVSLVSLNPKYAPMDFDASFGGVRILGVPVGFLRMYKEEA